MRARASRGGFSLIEMALVAVVLGILAGVSLPSLTRAIHRADAARIMTDVRNVEMAVQAHLEDTGRLPRTGRWGQVPADLVPYLPESITFQYKHLQYRLVVNRRRGRVRLQVRYPRNDAIGEALKRFRRAGEVSWTRRRTTFILDPE